MDKTGALVISVDFEPYWGDRDKKTPRQAIPALLEMFLKDMRSLSMEDAVMKWRQQEVRHEVLV